MAPDRGWVALVAVLMAAPARATPDVVGACPDVASVEHLLAGLLPAGQDGAEGVSIRDQGSSYRIAIGSQVTTLSDPARDCAARARQATAVVASGLRTHPQVFGPPRWTVEKGVVFDAAFSDHAFTWAPGAEIRGAFGRGSWSLIGAAGGRGPARLTFNGDSWRVEMLRFPLDAGARLTGYQWRLRPWLVLGPSLTLTGFIGEDLLESERVWRFDLGGIAMVGATLPVWRRMGIAAALSARWQPRPYQLRVAPVGKIGETPAWWVGLSLNYTIDAAPSSQ
jgi:hypothetical protein